MLIFKGYAEWSAWCWFYEGNWAKGYSGLGLWPWWGWFAACWVGLRASWLLALWLFTEDCEVFDMRLIASGIALIAWDICSIGKGCIKVVGFWSYDAVCSFSSCLGSARSVWWLPQDEESNWELLSSWMMLDDWKPSYLASGLFSLTRLTWVGSVG